MRVLFIVFAYLLLFYAEVCATNGLAQYVNTAMESSSTSNIANVYAFIVLRWYVLSGRWYLYLSQLLHCLLLNFLPNL